MLSLKRSWGLRGVSAYAHRHDRHRATSVVVIITDSSQQQLQRTSFVVVVVVA